MQFISGVSSHSFLLKVKKEQAGHALNAVTISFIPESLSDGNTSVVVQVHVWKFISSQGGSECLNSLRVILFLLSAILSGNTLYRQHADAHVYMYIYIYKLHEHYTPAQGCRMHVVSVSIRDGKREDGSVK